MDRVHHNVIVHDNGIASHDLHTGLEKEILKTDYMASASPSPWNYTSSFSAMEDAKAYIGDPNIAIQLEGGAKEVYKWLNYNIEGTSIQADIAIWSRPDVWFAMKPKLLTTKLCLKIQLSDHAVKHLKKLPTVTYMQATHKLTIVGGSLLKCLVILAVILELNDHIKTKCELKWFKKNLMKMIGGQLGDKLANASAVLLMEFIRKKIGSHTHNQ